MLNKGKCPGINVVVELNVKGIIILFSLFWTNVQLPLRRVGDKMIKYIKEMIGFSKWIIGKKQRKQPRKEGIDTLFSYFYETKILHTIMLNLREMGRDL